MYIKPFQPKTNSTFFVANAVGASVAAALEPDDDTVVLYNSSATAVAYWACQNLNLSTDTGPTAVVPTTSNSPAVGSLPIPPGAQIRVAVGQGFKKFSVIASAADGNLYITPGRGN